MILTFSIFQAHACTKVFIQQMMHIVYNGPTSGKDFIYIPELVKRNYDLLTCLQHERFLAKLLFLILELQDLTESSLSNAVISEYLRNISLLYSSIELEYWFTILILQPYRTYMNSSCTAYSFDMKGIWSRARRLASCSALSQCCKSFRIY